MFSAMEVKAGPPRKPFSRREHNVDGGDVAFCKFLQVFRTFRAYRSRGIVHKGIRSCPVSRGCGNGGGGTIYHDSFSRVPHRKGVAARSKQMVGGMGGGSLRTRIVTHGNRPCGRYVDTLTACRPVGCHRNLPIVGMRRVIKRVLHAGREQHGGCHSHHIYILSCFHILFLRVRITSIPMSHRH